MKKLIKITAATVLSASVSAAFATGVGVVNMKTIFTTSPQAKAITAKLKKQFAPQRADLMKEGKKLQADIKKLERNKAVMSHKQMMDLQKTVAHESTDYRAAQEKFQQALYAAQGTAMHGFVATVSAAAAKVAKARHFDVVLPKNATLYVEPGHDITSAVVKDLK